MIFNEKDFELIDASEKITIADSFVHPAQKLGRGHGEAKLYIGNKSKELWDFFGSEKGFNLDCFLDKKNLIEFIDDLKPEYENPNLPYDRKSELPNLFTRRREKLNDLNNIINFKMTYQSHLQGPRVYLNSDDENYQLLREIPLPRLCYLIFVKYKKDNKYLFKIRLFTNYREISETNEHPHFLENQVRSIPAGDRMQTVRVRRGQPEFREALLRSIPFCPVTTVTDERLLEACHIKPRRKCNTEEQGDAKNGLMLTPTIHQLFDDGFITFEKKKIKISPYISKITLKKLGIVDGQKVDLLQEEGREKYLKHHRDIEFKS